MSKKKIVFISVVLCLTLLFVFATFFDLQISKAVVILRDGHYYSGNYFADFIGALSEYPVYLAVYFFASVIAYKTASKDKSLFIPLSVFFGCILVVFGYYINRVLVDNFAKMYTGSTVSDPLASLCEWLASIVYLVLFYYIVSWVGKDKILSLYKFALCFIISVIVSYVLVQFLKGLFARPRFRAIALVGDYDLYKPWYKLSFFKKVPQAYRYLGVEKDGYKSFPSGHVSFVSALFMICIYIRKKPLSNKCAKAWYFIMCAYVGFVAVTRVLCGAHFVTDVIAGCALSYLISLLVYKLVFEKKSKIK